MLIVDVANQGRRSAFLQTVSAQLRDPGGSNQTLPFQARELLGASEVGAGASRRIVIEAKNLTGGIRFADIEKVIVREQTGRVWRSAGLESSYLTEIVGSERPTGELSTAPISTGERSIYFGTYLVSRGCVLIAQCESEAQRVFYHWLYRDRESAENAMTEMGPQVTKFLKSIEPVLYPLANVRNDLA